MKLNLYHSLVKKYKNSPTIYHATDYWKKYEKRIESDLIKLNPKRMRSGDYHSFCHFGFNETLYKDIYNIPFIRRLFIKLVRKIVGHVEAFFPYSINKENIRDMAYRYCQTYADYTNSKSINIIETSSYGSPQDLFFVNGKKYTMAFRSGPHSLDSFI